MEQSKEELNKIEAYRQLSKTFTDEQTRYADCMREIKQRLIIIKQRLALGSSIANKIYDTEVICLQFRSILELIVLSNLAAHQKHWTHGQEKLQKQWRTNRIIKFLGKANTNFYPTPVNVKYKKLNATELDLDLTIVEKGYLTKDEFNDVLDKCSDYLHPKNPFAPERDYQVWTLFEEWFHKIVRLLETHVIDMFETKQGLFIHINLRENTKYQDVYTAYLRADQKIVAPEHLK